MKRRAAALAALAAVSVSACSGGGEGTACPARQRCLRAGNVSDPDSLDPAHAFIKQSQTVIDDLLVGLTTFDAHGEVAPGMADRWSTSADGLTWRFHLRPALWSDGAPVTARDFVFTFRRLVAPVTGAGYAVLLLPVANAPAIAAGRLPPEALGVSAPALDAVEIRLAHPAPYLPSVLAHYGVVVTPEHAVRRWGERWTAPGRFVSNGPYRLAGWRLNDRITLLKNPRFYDAAHVCLDRVDYIPAADPISAERRVRRGELDWNADFAANRLPYLRGAGGMARYVRIAPWPNLFYLVFRLADPALGDVRVRQALAMAVDRDFIARGLLRAGATATAAFVPPGLGALPAAPDWAALPLSARQARARRLLAEAGYGPSRPLRLELKSTPTANLLSVAVQADWRAVGVEAGLQRTDGAVYFADLQRGDFQVGVTNWIADYLDPTDFLDLMRTGQSASNYGGYADPPYDALLDRAETLADPRARAELLHRAEVRMLQAAPVAPLFVSPSHNLVSPRMTGWYANINDVHPARWQCLAAQTAGASATR